MTNQVAGAEAEEARRKGPYRVGGTAALLVVLVVLAEIAITFLPGGSTPAETVFDWFDLLQTNPFMGLRNLGLLNIVMTLLGALAMFALYAAHRRANPAGAALAVIVSYIGVAVFLATNRAFPMLDLSRQYAAATTDAQRTMIAAAGQAMLSVGQSHTPGTFLGFFLAEVAGIAISVVMLRAGVFGKATAWAGILSFSFLLLFEVSASFVTGLSVVAMIFAVIGGLLNMAWYLLMARRFFQLGQAGQGGAG